MNPNKMAFQTTTKKGHKVYRITLDTNEILSFLENNKTQIRYDIICDKYGNPQVARGVSKGKPWQSIMFYSWATEKTNENTQPTASTNPIS